MNHKLEYIWLDGTEPTTQLRSKIKIVSNFGLEGVEAPVWAFDGSSTNQAKGSDSDCVLKPVRIYPNPLEEGNHYLVLCEVWNVDDTPHKTNTRHRLDLTLQYLDDDTIDEWVGFEQEYTLFENGLPFGWPEIGEPPPQGDYYCGRNAGEEIVIEHTDACIKAGISIVGTNAEVMLGQWEYQIGAGSSIHMSDDLWVARWLMEKICYKHGVTVSLDPKPIEGDWNGAGCHTNFSTRYMRGAGGDEFIFKACMDLDKVHKEHMAEYGEGNERRLTGLHETQAIDEFNWGVSDRGASIRIPWQVEKDGYGYLEDRRPSSNCDPYRVSKKLIETICD
jgi:glutamine synthetase